ncbi:hypothetical protein ACS0TY_029198 [Phlomoides rotata]
METLATESFSYSWLVEKKLPHSSYENPNQSFDFDVSFTSSSLVHADEIFSDGHIMPIYVDRSSLKTANSAPQSPVSFGQQIVGNKKRYFLLEKCRRILRKYFGFVKLYQKMGCWRKSNRVDDLERKVCENGLKYGLKKAKSMKGCSTQASSPRVSPARSSNAWCVDESSIHEAILYCKRSIET